MRPGGAAGTGGPAGTFAPYGRAVLTRPEDLGDADVAAAVAAGWGLPPVDVEHLPVGFGSHHWRATAGNERWFVTVDDLDARRRAGDRPGDPRRRLSAALTTACALREAGLAFVVAPLRTAAGAVLRTVGDRFAVALYPHVDGTAHPWGPYPTRAERLAVLDLVVALHRAPAAARAVARTDDLAVPGREELDAALAGLDRPWGPGPFAERAQALLHRHAAAVQRAVERHDRLAAAVATRPERVVLTHGEPHRGNTITTAAGPVLVDWDTTLVAPPERDLWALAGEDDRALDDYAARTGVAPSDDAIELYRLGWDLADIAAYVAVFRRPHGETADTRLAWDSLGGYLRPARWRDDHHAGSSW